MKTKALQMQTFLGMTCVLFFLLLFSAQHTVAQNAGNSKPDSTQGTLFSAPELDFFCKYMLNREFVMPADAEKTRRMDGGKVEIEFDRKNRIANLTVSPEGFTFNTLNTIKQTNYDLDANGKRILPGRVMDRNIVVKHSFGRSKSTGKLIGHMEIIYNDSPEAATGMTSNMTLFMEGDKMIMQRIPGGYFDGFAAGGTHKPRTMSTRTEIVVKEGKVIRTSETENFDVDPETMKMTPTGEKSTIVDYCEL